MLLTIEIPANDWDEFEFRSEVEKIFLVNIVKDVRDYKQLIEPILPTGFTIGCGSSHVWIHRPLSEVATSIPSERIMIITYSESDHDRDAIKEKIRRKLFDDRCDNYYGLEYEYLLNNKLIPSNPVM